MYIPDDLVKAFLESRTQAYRLFLWLYCNADAEGNVYASVRKMAEETRLSVQEVRSALGWFVSNTPTNTASNKQVTHVTICNIDNYRGVEKTTNTPTNTVTNKRREKKIDKDILSPSPSSPTPLSSTTTCIETEKEKEKRKNIYTKKKNSDPSDGCPTIPDVSPSPPPTPSAALTKIKDLETRQKEFADSIRPYVDVYSREMCNDFYAYWTEISPKGRKMRFEKETAWCISRRLSTWYRHGFNNRNNLSPEMKATLPDMFSPTAQMDSTILSETFLKQLQAMYTIEGGDGEWYSTADDARTHRNSLSQRIQKEIERKKSMQQ